MKNYEFRRHLRLIEKILIRSKNNRLILVNEDYSKLQQIEIDKICSTNVQITGQINCTSADDTKKKITELVKADKEPLMPQGQLKYIILGPIKLKDLEPEQLHV